MKFLLSLLFCFFLFLKDANAQFISVDENFTAEELVEDVLFSNSCGTISNVSVSGGNFDTGEKSWGYFNANASSFPFTDGIILSTGKITNAVGPNDSLLEDGGNMNWAGDSDLNQALGLSNSFNATVLEFDFVPTSNKISFDFILSSEQYLSNPSSNQCNFTDGFAFLLKGDDETNYRNIALVPGTNIPIKINTVRGSGTICPAANEEYFDAFNGINHPTDFNGQTKAITAEADVIAGNTYHIKLVIADEGNYRYDSAIFLKGGSFSFDVNLGPDRTVTNGNPVCYNETFTLDATTYNAFSYQWFFNGTPIPGETSNTLSFSPPYNIGMSGMYSVLINAGDACEQYGEVFLEFIEELLINQSTFAFCDTDENQDGIRTFTQQEIDNLISSLFINFPSNYNLSFFSETSASTPIVFPFTSTSAFNETIWARITNVDCYDFFEINLITSIFEDETPDINIGLCGGNSIEISTLNGYNYLWSNGETTQSITVNQPGLYTVELTNNNNCTVTQNFTIIGSEIATISDIIVANFTENNSAQIEIIGNGDYEFSLDGINYQESNIFNSLDPGEYIAYVNDKNGCGIAYTTFYVVDFPKFFTPNNDGFNDFWKIKNLDRIGLSDSKICIFDRYGKLIKEFFPYQEGWDGKFNGIDLPSEDYWFVLKTKNSKEIKGHFTLKR